MKTELDSIFLGFIYQFDEEASSYSMDLLIKTFGKSGELIKLYTRQEIKNILAKKSNHFVREFSASTSYNNTDC